MVTKIQNSNCDKTQILRKNSKNQLVIKLELWQNLRTQIMTNFTLKSWPKSKNLNCVINLNCDATQIVMKLKNSQLVMKFKLKLWQNSRSEENKLENSKCDKTPIVTKLKNSNYDTTQKLKLWLIPEAQFVTKLEILQISIYEQKKTL